MPICPIKILPECIYIKQLNNKGTNDYLKLNVALCTLQRQCKKCNIELLSN